MALGGGIRCRGTSALQDGNNWGKGRPTLLLRAPPGENEAVTILVYTIYPHLPHRLITTLTSLRGGADCQMERISSPVPPASLHRLRDTPLPKSPDELAS
jgi:hypothetical protein